MVTKYCINCGINDVSFDEHYCSASCRDVEIVLRTPDEAPDRGVSLVLKKLNLEYTIKSLKKQEYLLIEKCNVYQDKYRITHPSLITAAQFLQRPMNWFLNQDRITTDELKVREAVFHLENMLLALNSKEA